MPCAGATSRAPPLRLTAPLGLSGTACHRLVREGIGGFLAEVVPRDRHYGLVETNQHRGQRNTVMRSPGSAPDEGHAQLTSMALRPLLHRQINVVHNQSIELEPAMEVDNLAGGNTYS